MRRWQLWQGLGGHAYFPDDNSQAQSTAIAGGYVLTWHCMAKGINPAMRQLYAHLGWGEYHPMVRADGTPYPQDEDDAPVA
ncbi:MAG: hypothetical protein CTY20_01165 [Hyphomicrobium sp.]|nr:MAG: hypothetical protein CTY20_01165 [Hyphomicrobium sp.]